MEGTLYGGGLMRLPEVHPATSRIPERKGFAKTSQHTIDRHRNETLTYAKRSSSWIFSCGDWLRFSSTALQS